MPPRARVDHTLSPPAASIVQHGLRAAGLGLVGGNDHDLLWTLAPTVGELRRPGGGPRRISHITGSDALTNKARLAGLMSGARERASRLGSGATAAFYPRTFAIPERFGDLKLAAAYDPRARWIRRPRTSGTNLRPEPLSDVGAAGLDPRWIVQEVVNGSGVRVLALVSSLDPLTVDCWRPSPARRPSAQAWETIQLTIAAVAASAADAMRQEVAGLHVAAAPGFELLAFDFLVAGDGTVHLVDCAKWPDVRPAVRPRDTPKPDAASDLVVRIALERLGLVAATRASRSVHPLVPSSDPQRLALFRVPSPADVDAARRKASSAGDEAGGFQPQGVHHYFLDDALVLFSESSEKLSMLNPTASFVWLRSAEGAAPATVMREAIDLFHGEPEAVARDVWSTLAGWIAGGLLARRPPAASPEDEPAPSWQEHPRHGWNAGERIYEHLGRRICVRSAGGDADRWLSATLDAYEQPAAQTYHDLVEVLPIDGGFSLLTNGTRTVGPFAPRDTPAAVHRQIRHLPMHAIRCALSMRATLVCVNDAAVLLLNAAADVEGGLLRALTNAGARVEVRERLLWRGDPLTVTREASGVPVPLAMCVALERTAAAGPTAIAPLRRADALRQLIAEDPDAISVLTPDAANRLVRFVQRIDCARLLVGDEAEAAGCILRACASSSV